MARRSATIYDIARAADVSHQSVSRYMRGLDMRRSTKEKIEKALETLSYRPNLTARALITGRSHRIGALTHEVNQYGPGLIIQGATSAAREAGYLLDVIALDMGDTNDLNQALSQLLQYDLDGILAFASTDSVKAVFEQTDFGVPALVAAEEEDYQVETSFDRPGVGQLVSHLVGLGHERLLHIGGPETYSAARNRLRAFEAALAHFGLKPAGVAHGDWSARSAYQAVMALPIGSVPTAIVAANDQMALGAIHALGQRGLRVPEDVSVTGVDDTPEAAYFTPALTTIRLDFKEQGKNALVALLNEIGDGGEHPSFLPAPTLVLRDSTGPRSTGATNP
ncbi:substrate-binding domain-containing protein [Agromyces sp. ISL-38]|uniref:LacI family DNA-binding transcriptional regulator n=1 Tax=Agromyces sp. ISL-38 TaxID=2819107 RepID=UPI001BE6E027|nr:substrate-binding domain-containing protein [Agromyces sp. ISL-38]MBT2500874.1 substrate-binding domain-containing protein [Agromyces sp. ISL-38]